MTSPLRALAATAALLAVGLAVTACTSDSEKRTAVSFTADGRLSGDALKQAAEQLRHRAELLGLKDPRVSTDDGTLSLSAAGPLDSRIEALTHQVALEFRPVLGTAESFTVPPRLRPQLDALDCTAAAHPADPTAETVACSTATAQEPATKLALGPVAVKGAHIAGSTADLDGAGNQWQVTLTFTDAGATAFTALTTDLVTKPDPADQLAIVIDGAVVSHPRVTNPITGNQIVITGGFTHDQAQTLAAQLSTAALPEGLRPTGR
ncbi:SecDF P1 head subdomain-containing protein [Kitasatospora sp. NPDC092948]|uniref:SecDF P1 head subdomain-containing protein n=1 Tax=Kitasatospora sp. NPDC092948 TaxID=3364088 RepID=UPI00381FF76F